MRISHAMHMAMLNPTSSHHLELSIMPSTSYVPTFLRTCSPTTGGPLAPRQLVTTCVRGTIHRSSINKLHVLGIPQIKINPL